MRDNSDITLWRLKELIDHTGLSRQAIADEIGCDVSMITKQYNGQRNITPDFLIAYAQYFDVSTDYLLGLTDIRSADLNTQAICRYTGLDEKAVATLMDINVPANFTAPKEYIDTISFLINDMNYRETEDGYAHRHSLLPALSEYLGIGTDGDEQRVFITSNGKIFRSEEEVSEEFDRLGTTKYNKSSKQISSARLLDNMMLSDITDAVREAKQRYGGED